MSHRTQPTSCPDCQRPNLVDSRLARAAQALLFVAITASAAVAATPSPSLDLPRESGVTPQNVIVFLIDDLRYDALSCTGHPFVETPQIDRIAANGTIFRQGFVTTSLCSPSRASILTGQYMHHHGVHDNNNPAPPGIVYFPQYLQKAGYQTAFIGKWHMGGGSDDPKPGFDHWVSFKGQGRYNPGKGNWTLNVDGAAVPQKGYITDELTDYAITWLDKLDQDKPFFLELSHKAVHGPFEPAERHKGKYKDSPLSLPALPEDWQERDGVPMWVKNQRNSFHGTEFPYHSDLNIENYYRDYCEAILAVDDSIGRVLDWLDQHDKTKNTLIIFLGDNGFYWGEHGLIDKRSSYDESMRVPFLVQSPTLNSGGKTSDKIVANIDIAPTILAAAGLVPPESMDGLNMLPLIDEKVENPQWREHLLYEYYWEWNFPQTPTQFAVRGERWKLIEYHGIWDTDELFDLAEDPKEQNNLIHDPKHKKTADQLRRRLREMLVETEGESMPLGNKRGDGANLRRESGSKAAPFPTYILRK